MGGGLREERQRRRGWKPRLFEKKRETALGVVPGRIRGKNCWGKLSRESNGTRECLGGEGGVRDSCKKREKSAERVGPGDDATGETWKGLYEILTTTKRRYGD